MTWEEMLEEKHEEGYEEGFEKGLRDGIKSGIDQGPEQGLQQGIKQGKNQVLINLVNSNKISIEVAQSLTDDLAGFNKLLIDEPICYAGPDFPFDY